MANKLTIGLVAACGLLALGVGLYYHAELVKSQRAAQRLELEYTQSDARLKALSDQRVKVDAAVAAAKEAASRETAKADAAGGSRATIGAGNTFLSEATENPELRQALGKYFNAEFHLHYLQLAKMMGLSDDQMNQLADAYFKRWSDQTDLSQARQLSGDNSDSGANAAYQTLAQKVSAAYDDAVRGVVGDAGFQQIHDFDRTYSARTIAYQVAADAAASSAPLTPEQTDQLLQLVADGSPEYRSGGNVNPSKLDWDRVMTQATGMFSPAQLRSLNAIHAGQDMQSLSMLYLANQRPQ
jgi:hypothetical protein